ncbi:MAG: TerB family tellurite resistance protein [Chloroflexota bacterium]
MSLFRNIFNMDARDGERAPFDANAPLAKAGVGETDSVRTLSAALEAMAPARARYIAAFAYLLGRAANATGGMSPEERVEILKIAEAGGLEPATAPMVVDLAATLSGEFGATEDFLVTREFKSISTPEERQRLLRCCFMVMAADNEIDATESWLANRLAEELDVERPDLNRIRSEFHDQLSGIRALRARRER